jgi:hypothetical protein
VLPQHVLAKNLGEKAARVAMADRPYLPYPGDLGRNDLHAAGVLKSGGKARRGSDGEQH